VPTTKALSFSPAAGNGTTVGIPGTGMSYSERVSGNKAAPEPGEPEAQGSGNWLLWVIAAIFVGGVLYRRRRRRARPVGRIEPVRLPGEGIESEGR